MTTIDEALRPGANLQGSGTLMTTYHVTWVTGYGPEPEDGPGEVFTAEALVIGKPALEELLQAHGVTTYRVAPIGCTDNLELDYKGVEL